MDVEAQSDRMVWPVVLFAAGSSGLLGFFAFGPEGMPGGALEAALRYWLLFFLFGSVICGGAAVLWERRGWRTKRGACAAMLAAGLIGGSLLLLHERFLLDAAPGTLQRNAVARHMHLDRAVMLPELGRWSGDRYLVFETAPYNGAPGFSFLLSLVHDLRGFSVENVFLLNQLAAFLFPAIGFGIGRLLGGVRGGCVAAGISPILPWLGMAGQGSGDALVRLVLLAVLVFATLHCLRTPSRPRVGFVVVLSLLLPHFGGGASVYSLFAAGGLLALWLRSGRPFLAAALAGGAAVALGAVCVFQWMRSGTLAGEPVLAPLQLGLMIAAAFCCGWRGWAWKADWLVGPAVFVFLMAWTFPEKANGDFASPDAETRRIQWIYREVAPDLESGALFVDRSPLPAILYQRGALAADRLESMAGHLADGIDSGKYPGVYRIERREFELVDGAPVLKEMELPGSSVFEAEEVARRSFRPFGLTRVVRLIPDRGKREKKMDSAGQSDNVRPYLKL